ncbi:MAG TPA: hypothetical protein EYP14_10530 [Planctomycetaceae bacterium]|nr:hypothetical protein [Planctomycetaceae bacterium]
MTSTSATAKVSGRLPRSPRAATGTRSSPALRRVKMAGNAVLIVGGGGLQHPAVSAACALGLSVWVSDRDPVCPCARLADRFFPLDIYDVEGHVALARLLALIEQGTISGKIAKMVFEEMVASGQDPEAIIKERGLVQISDEAALETIAREILAAHPKEVADYQAGKTKVMGFFVGQMMKKTRGQANPKLVNQLFQQLLQE